MLYVHKKNFKKQIHDNVIFSTARKTSIIKICILLMRFVSSPSIFTNLTGYNCRCVKVNWLPNMVHSWTANEHAGTEKYYIYYTLGQQNTTFYPVSKVNIYLFLLDSWHSQYKTIFPYTLCLIIEKLLKNSARFGGEDDGILNCFIWESIWIYIPSSFLFSLNKLFVQIIMRSHLIILYQ